MSQVVHIRKSNYDVYIGRANGSLPASKWANPWVIGKDGTREEVIGKYEEWIKTQPELMAALPELRGKVLGCWCAPENCHGNTLLKLLNEPITPQPLQRADEPLRGQPKNVVHVDDAMHIPSKLTKSDILPVFSSDNGQDSILTFEAAGTTEEGRAASIIDIACANHLKQVIVADTRIDGFLDIYKNLSKPFKPTPPKTLPEYIKAEQGEKKTLTDEDRLNAQMALDHAVAKYEREKTWSTESIQLIYGIKMVVVPDMSDKTVESMRQESQVIIFIRNSQGYYDLLKIWNKAWVAGNFSPPRESGYGRIDWTTLSANWTENLTLVLPFFSSFLAKNTLYFSSIVPSLPVPTNEVILYREVDSGLPFAGLIEDAINRFSSDTGAVIQAVKSIYYLNKQAFDTYVTYRALMNRGEFSRPEVPHMCSNNFCFEEWLRLTKEQT